VILLALNSFVSLIIIAPRERTAGSLTLFSASPPERFCVKLDRFMLLLSVPLISVQDLPAEIKSRPQLAPLPLLSDRLNCVQYAR